MVGARKGRMALEGNLFATPARPGKLSIHVERLWVAGDDVSAVTMFTHPTKGSEGMWVDTQQFVGADVDVVLQEVARNAVARFYSGNWGRKGKQQSYEAWRRHIGLS